MTRLTLKRPSLTLEPEAKIDRFSHPPVRPKMPVDDCLTNGKGISHSRSYTTRVLFFKFWWEMRVCTNRPSLFRGPDNNPILRRRGNRITIAARPTASPRNISHIKYSSIILHDPPWSRTEIPLSLSLAVLVFRAVVCRTRSGVFQKQGLSMGFAEWRPHSYDMGREGRHFIISSSQARSAYQVLEYHVVL